MTAEILQRPAPRSPRAHDRLAQLHYRRGNLEQAWQLLQGWHELALLGCGLWGLRGAPVLVDWAAAAFALGLVLFCGAVYALALAGARLPAVAPAGGALLMGGWALLGVGALRA